MTKNKQFSLEIQLKIKTYLKQDFSDIISLLAVDVGKLVPDYKTFLFLM